jgi:heme/copper-type cytochrome/quinol oxidase subunit 2
MENEPVYRPLSLADWMLTIFITFTPLINIIMLFVWAFGRDTNPNRANWAKANLIWMLIGIILFIIFISIFGIAIFGLMKHAGGQEAF